MPSRSAPSTDRRRTLEPVARSALLEAHLVAWPRASPPCAAGSSLVTLVRVSSSMSCSVPPLVGAEEDLLARLLALQVALRARRPVVGRVGLAAARAGLDPSKPSSRSQRAQLAAARPPPISRKSTSGDRLLQPRPLRRENWAVIFVLERRGRARAAPRRRPR